MPWVADASEPRLRPVEATWLPQPAVYADYAVDRQQGAAGSTLELYRSLLHQRRMLGLGTGSLTFVEGYAADVLALTNGGDGRDRVLVVTNFGDAPVELPEGAEVVVASAALEEGRVPRDTTVWAVWL